MAYGTKGFLGRNNLTAYDALRLAGFRESMSNHESDMYVPAFPGIASFMKNNDVSFKTFNDQSQTPPVPSFEFPLQYDPFWKARAWDGPDKPENSAMDAMDKVLECAKGRLTQEGSKKHFTPPYEIDSIITTGLLEHPANRLEVMAETISKFINLAGEYGVDGPSAMKVALPLYAKALTDSYMDIMKVPATTREKVVQDIYDMAETGKIAPVIGEIIRDEDMSLMEPQPVRKPKTPSI